MATARAAVADAHRFSDGRGGTFRASVVSIRGGEVELRRDNGQTLTRPVGTFQPSDRDYIDGWLAEHTPTGMELATPASKISAGVSIHRDTPQPRGRNPDQRQTKVTLRVRVENDELTAGFQGLAGTIIALAQSATGEAIYKVYARETFVFDLPKGGRFDFEGKAFPEFLDDQMYVKFGYKFRGYVLVLQNALGEVIYFRTSPAYVQSAETALLLKAGKAYDRQFTPLQPLQRPN